MMYSIGQSSAPQSSLTYSIGQCSAPQSIGQISAPLSGSMYSIGQSSAPQSNLTYSIGQGNPKLVLRAPGRWMPGWQDMSYGEKSEMRREYDQDIKSGKYQKFQSPGLKPSAASASFASQEVRAGSAVRGLGGMSGAANSLINILFVGGAAAALYYGVKAVRRPGGVAEQVFGS